MSQISHLRQWEGESLSQLFRGWLSAVLSHEVSLNSTQTDHQVVDMHWQSG